MKWLGFFYFYQEVLEESLNTENEKNEDAVFIAKKKILGIEIQKQIVNLNFAKNLFVKIIQRRFVLTVIIVLKKMKKSRTIIPFFKDKIFYTHKIK